MPIGCVVEILQAFQRYVDYMNEHGQDDVVECVKDNYPTLIITMRGHMGETYNMEVYLSDATGELCIKDVVDGSDLLESARSIEEYELTEEVIHYIKFGKNLNIDE